ncbi:hypothetical protein LMG31506_00256 [Cupriavidus yeoncheonensis]|uniref:Uncharacterized protein n=2 Tax=Cupriavidus yeoncheonensis TaxID=1462994 RepID=A0A916N1F5_9BURK|nr:hypothetical protein LMG31506_00256 [Cupriavidus yeoncheonensis]
MVIAMKKLVWIAALAAATSAGAEDAYVYPFDDMRVGETVRTPFPTVLYLHKKCDLPLVGADHMRFYAAYHGAWDTGCWVRNLRGDAVIVVPKMPTRTIPLDALARADVQKDGTMTIKAMPARGR